MSSEKEWKTVNKGKKVVTNGKTHLKKNEKKKLANSMPRTDPILPLKETQTIYQRFVDEELKAELKAERHGKKDEEVKSGLGIARKKIKNLTLRDAIDGLDKEELDEIVSKSQKTNPNNPENVLKDLSSFINSQLPNPPNHDIVLSNKPHNFPLNEVSSPLEATLCTYFMHSKSDAVLLDCLDHCIESLITAVSKGTDQQSMGYRLIIQLILKRRPQLITNRTQKYEQFLQKHSTRPLRTLLVLWCFSQAGYTSLNNGLKIWFHLMFLQINVKNVNVFVVEFLEKLIKLFPTVPPPPGKEAKELVVSKTDYFKFFSEAHSTQSAISETLKERLKKLLPFIKQVAWNENHNHLENFFLGYLSRCVRDCPLEKKLQLLECSTECLLKEPKSFDAWEGKISKYPSQSAILLQHLQESKHVSKLLGKEGRWKVNGVTQLLPTLRGLKEDSKKGDEAIDDFVSCIESIEDMKQKGKRGKIWFLLFFLLLLTPFLLFTLDLHHHGSLQKTLTMKYAEQTGADVKVQQAISLLHHKYTSARQWAGDNLPDSLQHLPSLRLQDLSPWLKSLKASANRGVKKLNDHLPLLLEHVTKASEYIVSVLLLCYQHLCHLFHTSSHFLSTQVFVGEWSPEKLQKNAVAFTIAAKDNLDYYFKVALQNLDHVFKVAKKYLEDYFQQDSKK